MIDARDSGSKEHLPPGWVYFAFCPEFGAVKIGFSKNPKNRLSDLARQSPVKLLLLAAMPGSMDWERHFHELFREKRLRKEWFRYDADVHDWVKEIRLMLLPIAQKYDAGWSETQPEPCDIAPFLLRVQP